MNHPGPLRTVPPRQATSRWIDRLSHFEQLVESVEDYAIFTMSPGGIILDWNRGAERIKGYTADQIIGKHFSVFYSNEDQSAGLPEHDLETAGTVGKHVYEGWRYRRDGSRIWANVTITAVRDPEGELLGYLQITRDLTERMQVMEDLRQSEERFRLILENVQDYAIFMLDPEGHVMTWNTGARRIKGYEPSEIVGRHFSVFYPADSVVQRIPEQLLNRALREGRSEDEGWRVRKDGSLFWGNVIITALRDNAGELRGFAKITRDLTDAREIQSLQEQGRRKDVFLATLAHELRNPLAPVLPALEVMQQSPDKPELIRDLASTLRRQVDQMAHLIDDLLDMSRITSGKIVLKKSRTDLADVVTKAIEAVQPAIDKAGHALSVRLPDEPVSVEVDAHRLCQIVGNLLSNAAKYTQPGGRIEVIAEDKAPWLTITVRDNGIGIPHAVQRKIFDLFDQGVHGSNDGLGIGLTLVKNLVEMHGGRVEVLSAGEGKGSEFKVSMPVVQQGVEEPVVSDPSLVATTAKSRGKVLVADDGRSAADILGLFFKMEGMDAEVVYDGLAAVDKAVTFQPDLVMLDIGMPVMDGYEAARRIRGIMPGAMIVALSGWGGKEDRMRSAEAGFDMHLVKPAMPADLREVLAKFFDPAKAS